MPVTVRSPIWQTIPSASAQNVSNVGLVNTDLSGPSTRPNDVTESNIGSTGKPSSLGVNNPRIGYTSRCSC